MLENKTPLKHKTSSLLLKQFSCICQYATRMTHSMIGLPDYETYVHHMKQMHPNQPFMSYEEFFRAQQDRRYNGKGGFKCC